MPWSGPLVAWTLCISKNVYQLKQQAVKKILHTGDKACDADSSTNTKVGWSKNNHKPDLFVKRTKSSKT